jgi:aryl-alcohol dehydrogenase-like predicted oxidoreductase
LRQACGGSLRRLKVDRIDLYQFHWPDPRVRFEDSVGELARLREEGKIRHVGLSNVSVEQLRVAQKIVPIVSIQNRYNISDRASEDVLKVCERENIGFLPWAPLMGRSNRLEKVARAHNATAGQVTLAWLLWHSRVMLPIPGTSSLRHLEENVAAASLNISEAEFESLRG